MSLIRTCVLEGGPMESWSGEFVDRGQDMEVFGPPGESFYVYKRDDRVSLNGEVRWTYSPGLTKLVMASHQVVEADPKSAFTHHDAEDPEEPTVVRTRVEVRFNEKHHIWELIVDGEVVETEKQGAINSPEDAKNWLIALGLGQ